MCVWMNTYTLTHTLTEKEKLDKQKKIKWTYKEFTKYQPKCYI